jgi:hypothetical protein
MDAQSLIEDLWTCSGFEDFVPQTLEKYPERFSKAVIAVGDQYFFGHVPHEGEQEHKGCQAGQRSQLGIFLPLRNTLRYLR